MSGTDVESGRITVAWITPLGAAVIALVLLALIVAVVWIVRRRNRACRPLKTDD
jgi:hypothetical protein